jgi:hypothetical protein
MCTWEARLPARLILTPGTGTTNKAAQGTDGFVAKYDHAGNFIWVYTTNVSNVEVVRSMKATTLLNVAMTTLNNSSLQMIALDLVTGLCMLQLLIILPVV